MGNISEALRIALDHHQAGELKQAERLYRQILELQADDADALHFLGVLASQRGDEAAAIELIGRSIAIRPSSAVCHFNLAKALRNQGKLDQAIASYQRALQVRPDSADAHHNLGNIFTEQGKLDEAIACYQRVAQIEPDNPEAHIRLGGALKRHGKLDEAVNAYRRALQIKPEYLGPLFTLGNALRQQGQLDEAIACYQRVLQSDPEHLGAHINLGNVLRIQGRFEDALASYQRAVEIDPDFSKARLNRATVWLLLGNFEQGWPAYERCRQAGPIGKSDFSQPVWDGEPLQQRTIVLRSEQGAGDIFQFVRYAPLVKEQAAKVILRCPEILVPILRSCPGVDEIATRPTPCDVHVPLMSLPCLLHTTLETVPAQVPYLFPTTDLVQRWKRKLGPPSGFRIGIAWQGNPSQHADRYRSAPLVEFAPLAQLSGIELFSLQKGFGVDQLSNAGERFHVRVFDEDFDTASGAFMDSAAVIANLDLVISVDTAICHLAGALGAPVWVALPYSPDFRWMLDRDDSPWYPTMRLFRQRTPGDWAGVFQEIVAALREHLRGTCQLPRETGSSAL